MVFIFKRNDGCLGTKHRTFPPVFRFTPFFRIFRGKFTVVKFTLGHRKFIAVRNKMTVNSKKIRKKRKFTVLRKLRVKTKKNFEIQKLR